jgi:TolB-like protein
MSRLKRLIVEIHERSLWQALVVYLGASYAVLEAAAYFRDEFGLPDWLPSVALVLLLIGLPVVVVASLAKEEVYGDEVPAPDAEAAAAEDKRLRLVTWRTAGLSFLSAMALWGAIAAGLLLTGTYERVAAEERWSIAVLPFENRSPNPDDAYFADGFHEDVLNQLSKIASIDVLARQAVLRYRDSEKGPREIGRELNATAIVEGSVRREGDRVRITAQMIDASDESHLWSEQYDETLTGGSIFSIQSAIAQQVARAVGAVLSPREATRITRAETQSVTAYDLYLRARALGPPGLLPSADQKERIRLLKLSVEEDPNFAAAWGDLGWEYGRAVWYYGWDTSWADSALAVGRRAVKLAPDQPHGYRAIGYAYSCFGQVHAMEEHWEKAVELAPSDAFLIRAVAWVHAELGRLPEAIEWAKRAVVLAPQDVNNRRILTEHYVRVGLPDRAEEQLRVVNMLDPSVTHVYRARLRLLDGELRAAVQSAQRATGDAWLFLGASEVAAMAGDYQQALALAEGAADLGQVDSRTSYAGGIRALPLRLGFALVMTGHEEEGRRRLEESLVLLRGLIDTGADQPSLYWDLAGTYAALGRQAPAVEWAQKAIDAGYKNNPRLIELDPLFESLRGDPDFERILARMRADQEEMARRVVEQERGDGLSP